MVEESDGVEWWVALGSMVWWRDWLREWRDEDRCSGRWKGKLVRVKVQDCDQLADRSTTWDVLRRASHRLDLSFTRTRPLKISPMLQNFDEKTDLGHKPKVLPHNRFEAEAWLWFRGKRFTTSSWCFFMF